MMRLLRTIRGIVGTALAWAIPWGLLGGAALVAYFIARRGGIPYESPAMAARINWILFQAGAQVSAVSGALAGALFAMILAVRARRLTFAELSTARLAAYGAIGGGAIGAAVVGVMPSTFLSPAGSPAPLIGISAMLGAGSAVAMLRIARRQKARPGSELDEDAPEPALMNEAVEEVERLLAAPGNLTTVTAEDRDRSPHRMRRRAT